MAPDGVSRADFEAAVLSDVDPSLVDEVLALLHRRGIVWVRRNRGAVRVYPTRPSVIPSAAREKPLSAFLAALAPHVFDLAQAIEARKAGEVDGADRVRVSCGRIADLCRRHESRVALPEQRRALALVLPAPVLKALAFNVPELQPGREVESFGVAPDRKKRIASGLPIEDRVAAIVSKAGSEGITRTRLLNAIRPALSAAELRGVLGRLEAEGVVFSRPTATGGRGRPGVAYFSA